MPDYIFREFIMIDEIYPRLFLEILPEDVLNRNVEIRRLLADRGEHQSIASKYGELIAAVYKYSPGSDIGLKFGEHLWPQALCDYSRGIVTSNDVGAAFKLVQNGFHIHGASYYPFTLLKGRTFSFALTFPFKEQVPANQRRFCTEAVFSYMANTMKVTSDRGFTPYKVCFDFSMPPYMNEYKKLFGNNISFDEPLNMIEFDESYLSKTFSASNEALHKMYLKKNADAWKIKSREQARFEQLAITYMLKNYPRSFHCSELADMMNVSVRGLQKKLTKCDVTFSQLTNRVRKELAKIYLIQGQQSIDKTADNLGFQSRSGFTRFFKAEFNQTPIEYLDLFTN